MKRALVIVLCFTSLFAYPQFTDSLKTALIRAENDSVRCEVLSALVENEYDIKIWPAYNQKLLALSKKNLDEAKTKEKKDVFTTYYANAINNEGFLAQEYGNISKALECYFTSLELLEKTRFKGQLATTINNIAYVLMGQGDLDRSMEYVNKALKLQKQAGDENGIATSLNNLGNLYKRKKQNDKAINYFNEALALYKKNDHKNGIAIGLSNIASIYVEQKETDKAVEYYLQALQINKDLDDPDGTAYNLGCLANLMYNDNRLDEALTYALKSFNFAQEIHSIENMRNSSNILYKIYKKQNKNNEALKMFELSVQLRDSINNEATRKSSIKKDLQYSYAKKATADSTKVSEERKVIAAQLKQEETTRFALYGGLLLVGLFGAFMFNRFKITQKQNVLINEQKTELQAQKELVEAHQKETLDSIHYAKRIQTALIANSNFIDLHIPNNFIYFDPKDIVSGDFYWASFHNHKFYLAICDSTGHGVPGAFMSLLNMGFLSEAVKEKNIEKPHEIFNYVRQRLISSISDEGQKDGMDGILICIDKNTGTIQYCAANNEPILIQNGLIIELPKDKMPVGKGERSEEFTLHTIDLKPGDTLYLYTDGFADQFGGPKGKKFKYKQLNELLLSLNVHSLSDQKQVLESTFKNWKGSLEQVDDVLIVGIKM